MSPSWEIREGDCVEVMAAMEDCSIDAIVTDPPYGLEFMGKDWDAPWLQGVTGDKAGMGEMALADGSTRTLPSFTNGRTNPTCRNCGGTQRGQDRASRKRCACAAPDFPPTKDVRPSIHAFQSWCEAWAREALRVLKPGGHLLAFGGTRTYHRLACAVEDAGFEIRDSLMWLYGSGFPKSLDVQKALTSEADREGRRWFAMPHGTLAADRERARALKAGERLLQGAEVHAGEGTALKPAHEPIVVARKPLVGTVAANVLEHGTGAINVDGCRVGFQGNADQASAKPGGRATAARNGAVPNIEAEERIEFEAVQGTGRWPANVVLSHAEGCLRAGERSIRSNSQGADEAWECVEGCPVAALDEQSGELLSGANPTRRGSDKFRTAYGDFEGQRECDPARGADRGGASRFFYCAKTSRAERNAGLSDLPTSDDHLTVTPTSTIHKGRSGSKRVDEREYTPTPRANVHPTVKPIELMRWLVKLVTPGGGLVLDPFNGSGTTGCAAVLEGFDYIGVEREAEYVSIAKARIAWWAAHPEGVETERVYAAEKQRAAIADSGQLSIGEAA